MCLDGSSDGGGFVAAENAMPGYPNMSQTRVKTFWRQ